MKSKISPPPQTILAICSWSVLKTWLKHHYIVRKNALGTLGDDYLVSIVTSDTLSWSLLLRIMISLASRNQVNNLPTNSCWGGGEIVHLVQWNLIWVYTFLSLPKTTPVFEIDEAARMNKNKFANRTFFESSIEISGLFRSPSPSGLFPPRPNWSWRCCYQCIHFRLLSGKSTFISPKVWLAIKFIKIQEKFTKNRIVHIKMGRQPPTQKKKWRLFNERIDSLKLSLRLGNRDLKNYWNTIWGVA